jgi:hypothetical protein
LAEAITTLASLPFDLSHRSQPAIPLALLLSSNVPSESSTIDSSRADYRFTSSAALVIFYSSSEASFTAQRISSFSLANTHFVGLSFT